jgi:transcriptional regulator with XRE-family HTH domain
MEKTIYTKEYTTFLKCLRKARTEAGITQIEMAERIEQTQSFVSRCERGERRIDIIELRVFCQAIGVPITDFIAQLEEAIAAGD